MDSPLLVCLSDLLDVDENEFQEFQEWLETVNSDGLTQVNNNFSAVSRNKKKIKNYCVCLPAKCIKNLKEDDDVRCVWF